MKSLVVILLLSVVAVAQTYTTNFPLTENPISEGGKWINAGVVGLDWNNVRTTPGFAFGTDPGTVTYADAWALLTGTWGPDQTVQATINEQNPNTSCHQETELVLRGNLSAHSATGYEITLRATNDANSYLLIARWNGALGDFNYLAFLSGSAYGVKTGDIFQATIVGNVITSYINGVQKAKVTDNTYATGHPGMGFYLDNPTSCSGTNADYGYTNYTAVATRSNSSFVQANSGPSTIQSSNSSVAVSYLNPQSAGNLNIVAVGWGDTTSSISSITDTQGNTYIPAVGPTSTTGLQQSIYYAKNIMGGSNKVTVMFSQAASYPDVRVLEYSGADTTNPLDVTAAGTGTGTAANSGFATTTSSNELIFGSGTTGNAFSAAGSGFTSRMINIYGNIAEDKIVTSSGSYNATATTSSSNWVMQMATFRSSGSSSPPNPAPTVNSISPTSGSASGGTAVSLIGTGFLSGATVKLGGTTATNVTVVSSTSITATTAAHTAGTVAVVVTNTDGQSGTLSGGYTYTSSNPAPTVNSISPTSGSASGGTAVSLIGTGFLSGATVELGGTTATNVTVVSSTSITATTAAHTAGTVAVVVTNTDGQSGTLSGGYTYTSSNPAPTVNSISPTSGSASGGTAVSLIGTGFLSGATVKLGGTTATNVTVVSSTSITATTAAHTAGTVAVVVTNTDGQSGTLSGGYTYFRKKKP